MTAAGPRIIVIGSGGAGYCAAIAAREAGASVLLISKSPLGMASCTAYAGGGFTAPIDGFTPQEHMQLTQEVGRGLSEPAMHRAVSLGAADAFAKLAAWGVRYDTRRGGLSVSRYGKGGLLGGTGMTLPLRDHAAAIGVETVAGLVVTAILRAADGTGRAVGVEVYDPASGGIDREPADAVIVASGGAGAIYARTDNPARTTGDGYRLLYAAGVPAFDMEFVQWYPLGYAEPGFPTWMIGLPIIDHVPLETAGGDRFYDRLLAAWGLKGGAQANIRARDRSAVAIAREWADGREVVLRYDLADPASLPKVDPLAAARFKNTGGPRPVRVAPLVHYFCGGAVASPDGATCVPGLYACGEVVGGFDGANRAGGNALTAVTVLSQLTGTRVAREAAATAGSDPVGDADAAAAVACGSLAGLAATWATPGSGDAAALTASGARDLLHSIVGRVLGVIRNAEGLAEGLAELQALRAVLPGLTAATAGERLLAAELPGLLLTAELVATAALQREESRGGHFRTDFPAETETWTRHIVIEPAGAALPRDAAQPQPMRIRLAEVGAVSPPSG
jgi:succinate dehydrogenase/fumarate reductase flavoprotein subunit